MWTYTAFRRILLHTNYYAITGKKLISSCVLIFSILEKKMKILWLQLL